MGEGMIYAELERLVCFSFLYDSCALRRFRPVSLPIRRNAFHKLIQLTYCAR